MCGLKWGRSFLTTSPVSFPPPPPWKLVPRDKHSLFSSQEPVVSWSRGSLQIKPSGSGDENGTSSSPVIARARYWTQKSPFFQANSAKKAIVSGLQQSSCYLNLYTALGLKTKCFIYRQTKTLLNFWKKVCSSVQNSKVFCHLKKHFFGKMHRLLTRNYTEV